MYDASNRFYDHQFAVILPLVQQNVVASHSCLYLDAVHYFKGSYQHTLWRRQVAVSSRLVTLIRAYLLLHLFVQMLQDLKLCCLIADEFYMGPVFSSSKQLNSTPYRGQWRSVQMMCGTDCLSDERCTFVTAWQNRPGSDYWCAFYNNTFQEEQTQLPYQVDVQKKLFGRSGK